MSVEVMGWVLDQQTDYLGRPLRGTAKLVLLGIANHAAKDGTQAWPVQSTLARYAGVTVPNVRRALDDLWEGGLVSWEHKGGGGKDLRNDERPNHYTIHMAGPHELGPRERQQVNPAREAKRQVGRVIDTGADPRRCDETDTRADPHGCDEAPVSHTGADPRGSDPSLPRGRTRANAMGQKEPSFEPSFEPSLSPSEFADGAQPLPLPGIPTGPSEPAGDTPTPELPHMALYKRWLEHYRGKHNLDPFKGKGHAITAQTALKVLLPSLGEPELRAALRYLTDHKPAGSCPVTEGSIGWARDQIAREAARAKPGAPVRDFDAERRAARESRNLAAQDHAETERERQRQIDAEAARLREQLAAQFRRGEPATGPAIVPAPTSQRPPFRPARAVTPSAPQRRTDTTEANP